MSGATASILATFSTSLVLAAVYFYLYRAARMRYLLVWGYAWAVYAARFVFELLLDSSIFAGETAGTRVGSLALIPVTVLASSLLLFWGSELFAGRRPGRVWVLLAAPVTVWTIAAAAADMGFMAVSLPVFLLTGGVYVHTGVIYLRSKVLRLPSGGLATGQLLTGVAFILWGLHKIDYPLLRGIPSVAPGGFLVASLLQLLVALGMLFMHFDRMQMQLTDSEGRLRLLTDNVRDVIFRYRYLPTRGFEYVSPAATEVSGYTPQEHYDDPDLGLKIIHPNDAHLLREGLKDRSFFAPEGVEFRWITRRGDVVWVEQRNTPVFNADGRVVSVDGVARDITERKKLEEEHNRLASAVEQVAEMVVVTDAQARLVYVNPAFERVTGYSRSEVLGRQPRFLGEGVEDESTYGELWDSLWAGHTWTGTLTERRKNGEVFEEEISIAPVVDATGEIVNYVSVGRDVTVEKQMERRMAQSQRIEALGRLAGGIAHDMNNLLTVVSGHTQLLIERADLDDESKDDLLEIGRSADRGVRLVRRLLEFSRKQDVEPQLLDVGTLVRNADVLLRRLLGEDVDFVVRVEQDLWHIRGDEAQLDQVIMNLVVNARDAIVGQGSVWLTARNIDLDSEGAGLFDQVGPGPYVSLTVADTGKGIDEETKVRLFEPFFTTKSRAEGTGLGLSTVYGIIRQFGGDIRVESEPDRGATFEVILPAASDPVPDEPGDADGEARALPSAAEQGDVRILLVEDEPAVRRLCARMLRSAGYQVVEAADGLEALDVVAEQEEEFDLVVSDVVMPKIGGVEMVRSLKQDQPDLKAVFTSGYVDHVDELGEMLGADMVFLEKPFTAESLLRKVAELRGS